MLLQKTESALVLGTMPDEQQVISDYLKAGIEQPSLLLWQYRDPAVIMGCSQRPDEAQSDRAMQAGLPIMRRGSGGGAVLAGPWMLSFTLFIPADHPIAELNIIDIFGWFEQIWMQTLQQVGVPAQGVNKAMIDHSKKVAKEQSVDWACYAGLSHGEIVSLDGRKLVGLAQIRKRKGVALVSGLHLAACDWSLLSQVVVNKPEQGEILQALNSDAEALSGIDKEKLLPSIIRAFSDQLPSDFTLFEPTQEL